ATCRHLFGRRRHLQIDGWLCRLRSKDAFAASEAEGYCSNRSRVFYMSLLRQYPRSAYGIRTATWTASWREGHPHTGWNPPGKAFHWRPKVGIKPANGARVLVSLR